VSAYSSATAWAERVRAARPAIRKLRSERVIRGVSVNVCPKSGSPRL
jgi:ribosomal protein L19E